MSKSLIQTINQSLQTVALNSTISLGSVLRRFGCNLRLNGDAIEANGEGYYTIDCNTTVVPTAAGTVTVALYANGIQIPGAVASGTGTAGSPITLPISTTIRQSCCGSATPITCVLTAGAGSISNITVRAEKV